MPTGAGPTIASGPEEAHEAILRFLNTSKQPVLIEPGDAQFALTPDSYFLEFANGKLSIQAWDRERTLHRKITAVISEKLGTLELAIERFGKKTGTLQLVDVARPRSRTLKQKTARLTFRESFRRMLGRQFAGWEIVDLTSETDLQHSLSPAYSRAFLKKGPVGWAAMGAPPEALDVDGILSFGLIWLDYLRRREEKIRMQGLALFMPAGQEKTTCLRLRYLDSTRGEYAVFRYSSGFEQRLDLNDFGNLDTHLRPRRSEGPREIQETNASLNGLRRVPGVDFIESVDETVSIRIRGVEFAKLVGSRISFGLETKTELTASNTQEMEVLATEVSERRSHDCGDRKSSLYQRNPELWLESQVRRSIAQVDAALNPAPLYGQVPAFAAGDRGVIDLLGVDFAGRLVVMELKASPDIHLPLQALDYWMRVNWHAVREEFQMNGYFAGIPLLKQAPRLLLIAPSLDFHPSIDTILKYFAPEIEVERIGLSMDWRREVHVVFRLRGSESRA